MSNNETTQIQQWQREVRAGNAEAQAALLRYATERFRSLVRQVFHREYSRLRRWEETDDVVNEALRRLELALLAVDIKSTTHLMCLMANQIRRTLIDLCRSHFGPEGYAAHHHSHSDVAELYAATPDRTAGSKPSTVAEWQFFYEAFDQLDEPLQKICLLKSVNGMSHVEIAEELEISVETSKKRYAKAKDALRELLADQSGKRT